MATLHWIPRERLEVILRAEIRKRDVLDEEPAGKKRLIAELAQSTGAQEESIERQLTRILTGNTTSGHGTTDGRLTRVTLKTADMLLTGLGLNYLWHTELGDLYHS